MQKSAEIIDETILELEQAAMTLGDYANVCLYVVPPNGHNKSASDANKQLASTLRKRIATLRELKDNLPRT